MRKSYRGFPCASAVPVLMVSVLLLACSTVVDGSAAGSAGTGSSGGPPGGVTPCLAGELTLDDGRCQPAGLPPEMACPPAELPLEGGGCQPAGVPPEACAAGFVADGRGGCDAVLPEQVCPPGQMAVPGETACREVAPCGQGTYGDIPIETDTVFVDASYLADDSDGSQQRPWKSIQRGVDAAAAGAIVAVAAGRYAECVILADKPVRLWGRCPAQVEVAGSGGDGATVEITGVDASDSELHRLAITGTRAGVQAGGSSSVTMDQIWIHQTGGDGLVVFDSAAVTLRSSLIEQSHRFGALLSGGEAAIEASVVRATAPIVAPMFRFGWGVVAIFDEDVNRRSRLTMSGSVVEQNIEYGVGVSGSDATIEASVVRSTLNPGEAKRAAGIDVRSNSAHAERGALTLRRSLVAQNFDTGIWISGSNATIESSVVRDTQFDIAKYSGEGVLVLPNTATGGPGVLTVRASLIERNHSFGLMVSGSDVTLEASIVRDTEPVAVDQVGRGIAVQMDPDVHKRGVLRVRASLIEQNRSVNVSVLASDATLESSIVRSALPSVDGKGNWGVGAIADPVTGERGTLTVRGCLIEKNEGTGFVLVGSDGTLEASVVRDTLADAIHETGGGIVVSSNRTSGARGSVTVRSSLIAQNQLLGVMVDDSDGTIESSLIRDTQPSPAGNYGIGLAVQSERTGSPGLGYPGGTLTVRATAITGNSSSGVLVLRSDATIESSLVKGTLPQSSDGLFGDGIFVVQGSCLVSGTEVMVNGRAGLLFAESTGAVSNVTGVGNRFGLVLQGDVEPDIGEGNSFEGNTEQDRISSGDLAVPDGEVPLP